MAGSACRNHEPPARERQDQRRIGGCEGDGTAEYVSVALYDAETVGGESEAVGVAGCLLHASGECDPIMASNATGTANYGPGQIAAVVGGRGVVTGVPTVLAV